MDDANPKAGGYAQVLGQLGVAFLAFSALSPVVSFYIAGDAVLKMAGTGAALAYIAGGVAAILTSLTTAELGAAFPNAGGLFPAFSAVLGRIAGYPYSIIMIPVCFAQTAFFAYGLGDYVHFLVPQAPVIGVAALTLVVAGTVAAMNVRFGAIVTGTFLAMEFTTLAVMSIAAVLHPVRGLGEVLQHPVMLVHGALQPTPFGVIALAFVSGLWATSGAGWALYFCEEMREAQPRIGKLVARVGLLAALVIATPMVVTVLGIDDLKAVLGAEAPIATALRRMAGPVVANLVSLGVAAAILNAVIATIMGYARFIHKTGQDNVWPVPISGALGRLHPTWRSPLNATILVSSVAMAALFLGEKALLILISGNVAEYALTATAVLVGRRRGVTGAFYKAPLHPVMPVFGLAVTGASMVADWFDIDAGRPSVILLTTLFLAAMAWRYFRLRASGSRLADALPPS